jgi:cytochrome c553/DNA-binding beta-propeller fold protein YncE
MPNSLRIGLLTLALLLPAAPIPAQDAGALFTQHCAACHGGDRLGAIGPALIPDALGRTKPETLAGIIAAGRPATQMPGFADTLTDPEITALARYITAPLLAFPSWTLDDIRSTHVIHTAPETLPARPVFTADPLNLFTVVEAGDHHVTILDGDRMEPLTRFQSRFALHGGAKYSPDGRFVYLASRDGWVTLYDLWSLQTVAEIRAGINTRNIAVSSDGRFVMVGNMLPHTLVVLDARDLTPIKVIPVTDGKGHSSRVSAVYTAPPRKSFIVALKDMPEIWEISTNEHSRPVYSGLVHSYEKGMVEAIGVQSGLFAVRRIALDDTLDDFFFDLSYTNLIGASRDGARGQVVNLNVGRPIAAVDLPGMPHLGSGITWDWNGRRVMATPHIKEAAISIIDMQTWKTVKRLDTLGPGFFMRSHENSPYAWTDASLGARRDTIQILDKRTLEIVRTLTPSPGKTASHVEFSRDGRFALVSVWENDGALVVYDAATFEEIKRLPMRKPSGKYNVWNKIRYSEGTSH